jgi:hypothetical protein
MRGSPDAWGRGMVLGRDATASDCTGPYRRRRPQHTLRYRTVQTRFATWLALAGDGNGDPVAAHVELEFRRYLDCAILAHGFARARCGQCGHDVLIAFSCTGRGVCPSCNARRRVATAAQLTDHVLPRLPVRQWVLAVVESKCGAVIVAPTRLCPPLSSGGASIVGA